MCLHLGTYPFFLLCIHPSVVSVLTALGDLQ